MNAVSKMRLLPIAAIVSIAIGTGLALGYTGYFGIVFTEWLPTGAQSKFVTFSLTLDEGRVQSSWLATLAPPVPSQQVFAAQQYFTWRGNFRWRLNVRRVLWEFDLRVVAVGQTGHVYGFRAPIWCFELPCLIAPVLWLRARRRRAKPVGFAVIASEAEQPSDDSDTAAPI